MKMNKKEYKKWCESCEFIQKEMQFYSYKDFVDNVNVLKYYYDNSDKITRKLYQWYVNSKPMSYNQKSIIWDYLNDYCEYEDLILYI